MLEQLSYSQSLRVVGQNLDPLSLDGFELAKWADDYVVWPEATDLTRKSAEEKGLLTKISRKILGNDPAKQIPNYLYFTAADIVGTDTRRRLDRNSSVSQTDSHDLSSVLRVLGNFLDRKNAHQFTIAWTQNSITVRYDQKQECFTSENMYDFAIHMYLKRSSRDPMNA